MIRRVEQGPDPGTIIFYVQGDVDLDTRASLEAALDHAFEERARSIVINLLSTAYIDSEGLATLISTHRRAVQSGVKVALVVRDERLVSLFRITRLDAMFLIFDSNDDALRALRGEVAESPMATTTTTVADASPSVGAAHVTVYDGTTHGMSGPPPVLEVSATTGQVLETIAEPAFQAGGQAAVATPVEVGAADAQAAVASAVESGAADGQAAVVGSIESGAADEQAAVAAAIVSGAADGQTAVATPVEVGAGDGQAAVTPPLGVGVGDAQASAGAEIVDAGDSAANGLETVDGTPQ